MKVGVYLGSANHPRFRNMLEMFARGVSKQGDDCSVILHGDDYTEEVDVAVIFGSWKDRPDQHHVIKNHIVKSAKQFIVCETPILGRKEVKNVGDDDWYRIGLNGFLADTGNFNNKRRPGDRWKLIQEEFGLEIDPWKQGDNILLVLQVPGDASLNGVDINQWAYDTGTEIRKYTDRPIILRAPQVHKVFDIEILQRLLDENKNINFQKGEKENLIPTIKSCFCTVAYSSGLSVESALLGVPAFALNKSNFAYKLGNNFVKNIQKPKLANRSQWLNNLSYAQWSLEEITEGRPWQHLREVLLKQ